MDVVIRPLQPQDAYTSIKWRNDPEILNTRDVFLSSDLITNGIGLDNNGDHYED